MRPHDYMQHPAQCRPTYILAEERQNHRALCRDDLTTTGAAIDLEKFKGSVRLAIRYCIFNRDHFTTVLFVAEVCSSVGLLLQ